MSILQIITDEPGQINSPNVRRVKIISTSNLAAVTTAGYLNPQTLQGFVIYNTDVIDMWYGATGSVGGAITSPGTYEVFTPSISNGVITLVQWANPGDVLLPVVSGDFAIFNGTSGQIKDAGYSPSNATKTKVVMANSATTANHIGTFTDTAGTLGQDAATAINLGNIQAGDDTTKGQLLAYGGSSNGHIVINPIGNTGNTAITIQNAVYGQATVLTIPDPGSASASFVLNTSSSPQSISGGLTIATGNLAVSQGNVTAGSSGHAGTLTSFPSTASNGSLILAAANNSANHTVTITNATSIGQDSVIEIPDPGLTSSFLITYPSAVATNKVSFSVLKTLTFTQLASAGKVNIVTSPTISAQFVITDIKVLTSTGLSGGGGDRLLAVTDGTLVFNNAGITAALLGTPIFTLWGGTGNPIAVSASQVSTSGEDIYFQYTGGTTDYTAGSVQVIVTLVQVTS